MKSAQVGIIDYGAGNIGSLVNMIDFLGLNSGIISKPEDLSRFGKVILPGVGHFGAAMERMTSSGFDAAIQDYVRTGNFLLGICLGFQLLTKSSEEGMRPGLGLIDAHTIKFPGTIESQRYPVPHMGWRKVSPRIEGADLFLPDSRFYFVHSYYVTAPANSPFILSSTNYGGIEFISAAQQENILGFQFHPEKSHKYGIHLLKKALS